MNKYKSEKGGITLFVIVSILFIMAILIGIYWKSTNYQVTVLQAEQQIKDSYGRDVNNVDLIYQNLSNASESYVTVTAGVRVSGGNGRYNGAVIPEGFTVSKIPGEYEKVDKGIVIYDIPEGLDTNAEGFWTADSDENGFLDVQENYNQFVWVPVATPFVTAAEITDIIDNKDLTSFTGTSNQKAINYLIANENKYPMAVKMSDGNYRGILYDFAEGTNGVAITAMDFSINPNESYDYNVSGYKTYSREPGMVSYDYGKDDSGNVLDTNPNTIGLTQIKLQNEYNSMLESVSRYKGFFVARYELSYDTKGESKRNKAVTAANSTNTKTWYGLYSVCQGMYNSNTNKVQSTIISETQYDQTMIWMRNVKNISDNSKYYILYSLEMGSYSTENGSGVRYKTGEKENYKVNQIYDLAGNHLEFTIGAVGNRRVFRGGSYANNISFSACTRSSTKPIDIYITTYSRPTLYIKIPQVTTTASSNILNPGERAKGENKKYLGITVPEGFTVSGIKGEYESVDNGIVVYDIPANVDTSVEGFWTKTTTIDGITCPEVQTLYNQFVWVPVKTAYVNASQISDMIASTEDRYSGVTNNQTAIDYLIEHENKYPMAVKMSDGNYRGILYSFTAGDNKVNINAMEFSINPQESYETKWKTLDNASDTTVYKEYYREPGMVCYDFGIQYNSSTKEYSTMTTPVNTIGLTMNGLQAEYNSMVESVSKNKGFYVARYELGYNTETNKGESKRAQQITYSSYQYTKTWYGLYSACKNMYTEKLQSMMISGAQWDQIMIWMKNVNNITDSSKYYILDSTGMGIYKVGNTNGILSNSGSNDNYKVNQVFDLGGNYWEWTSEVYSTYFRIFRGGYGGTTYPASYNLYGYGTYGTFDFFSSRPTLYIK